MDLVGFQTMGVNGYTFFNWFKYDGLAFDMLTEVCYFCFFISLLHFRCSSTTFGRIYGVACIIVLLKRMAMKIEFRGNGFVPFVDYLF